MITPLLEKAILKGWGRVEYINHSHGMLGRIPVSSGKLSIITKITWWPFVNPQMDMANANNSWLVFFKGAAYQLKLRSPKGTHNFIFRNSIKASNVDNTKAFNLQAPIAFADFEFLLLQPGEPVIQDCYIPVEQYCNIIISRMAAQDDAGSTYQAPIGTANEPNAPEGVGNIPVLANEVLTDASASATQDYAPPSEHYTGLTSANPTKKFPYSQDIIPQAPGIYYNSELSPNDGTCFESLGMITLPLVTFEVVHINRNVADLIQNA